MSSNLHTPDQSLLPFLLCTFQPVKIGRHASHIQMPVLPNVLNARNYPGHLLNQVFSPSWRTPTTSAVHHHVKCTSKTPSIREFGVLIVSTGSDCDNCEVLQLKVDVVKYVIFCFLGIVHFGIWDSVGQQGKKANYFLYYVTDCWNLYTVTAFFFLEQIDKGSPAEEEFTIQMEFTTNKGEMLDLRTYF